VRDGRFSEERVRYTPTNVTTAVMLGLTVWLLIGRFRARGDSNWPLFYYVMLVAYHQLLPGRLNPYAIYTSVIAALFIRFEFTGGWIGYLLRFIELGILIYLVYRFSSIVGI
jgi:hypothetical protein